MTPQETAYVRTALAHMWRNPPAWADRDDVAMCNTLELEMLLDEEEAWAKTRAPVLTDIADMPGFNVNGPQNGIRSVSSGLIEWGREEHTPTSIHTVRCVTHGATNCVAVMEVGRLYRCLTCNEGAFRPAAP